MKITSESGSLQTRRPKDALRLNDLQPGDVFRFAKGAAHNIYIMSDESHFHINGASEYHDFGHNPYVILYPDAELTLGSPISTLSELDERNGKE